MVGRPCDSSARGSDQRQRLHYPGAVPTFAFLSDEWITEAKALRAEYAGKLATPPVAVRMNLVVNEVPFGEGKILAHVDTSSGDPEVELGHLDAPDLTITSAYDTVKAIFVDGDVQAGMQAFMSGQVKVDGDVTKLMALQSSAMVSANDPTAVELAKRVQSITA